MYYRVLILLLISPFTMAASFDCRKAQADIEHAICDNVDLSAADSLLSKRYRELRQSLSKSDVNTLKQEQRDWLKQRLKQCSVENIACLVNIYQARIAEFETRLGIEVNTLSATLTTTVGRKVSDFVLPDYEILDVTEGDLNRDKYTDVILILKQQGEEFSSEAARPLLILTRDANNVLHLKARNDIVVLCSGCGGVFGDPYSQTVIKNGYFTVEHYGGSSWRWTRYITFKYVAKKSNWYLHKVTGDYFHLSDPENKQSTILTTKDFGETLFADYQDDW